MKVLICNGDSTNPATWSGTPYHFLEAGRRCGFLDRGLALDPGRLKGERVVWNTLEFFRAGTVGGFQYSADFIGRMMAQVPPMVPDVEWISHYPLLPDVKRTNAPFSYYIDATQAQIFDVYGIAKRISKRVLEDALKREKLQYAHAERVVCMSRWAARSVVERYGVPAERVFVVPGGANVDENQLQYDEVVEPPPSSPLRLGFIGVDWRRKNLPFILKVADSLQRRGQSVTVEALGFAASDGPNHPLLRVHGFLHKVRDAAAFNSFLRGLHFGCLFSHAEAYGLANVECLRLGVPVLTWDVGGLADTVPEGMGIVFPDGTSPDAVADVVDEYARDEGKYMALRALVRRRAREVSWEATVARMSHAWAGEADDRFDKVGDQPRRMPRELAPARIKASNRF